MKILGFEWDVCYNGPYGPYIKFDDHREAYNYIEKIYNINDWNTFLNAFHFKNFDRPLNRLAPEFKDIKDIKRLVILLSTNLLIDIR